MSTYLRTGAVAKATGVSRETIRLLSNQGVIEYEQFTPKGHRYYELDKVKAALKARSRALRGDMDAARRAGEAAAMRYLEQRARA